ncbi:MAG TPA: hypothetical protein VNW92_02825, partial [Polyangiaceae bacterium]|nr:hypothetical protein [Polyangiaceae bacterium]
SSSIITGDSFAGEGGEIPMAICGGTDLAASPKPVNILLVVDKSSSMTDTPVGFGDTKWNGIRTALGTAIDATKGQVAFGLDFFPSSGSASTALANVCQLPTSAAPTVPIAAGLATNSAIEKALADNAPAGATPTAAALGRALTYFKTGPGAALPGGHYVLLATDGGPNCDAALTCTAASCTTNMDGKMCGSPTANCCDPKLDPQGPSSCLDDAATIAAVAQLAKANVKTFVVGIPGTEAYQSTLDAVATAGGEPNPNAPPSFFSVSAAGGVKALSQVLTNIATGLITSCELVLSADPPNYDQINVVIDGTTILEGSADGWTLDTTNKPPTVVLKGATCKAVETNGAQQLSITFGCPTQHVK